MIVVTDSHNAKAPERSKAAAGVRRIRQLHTYLGVFFAPSILFFAFTGSLQLFSLHEGHPGDAYQPPAWIEKLASIHKDQRLEQRHGPPPAARPPDARAERRANAPRPQAKTTLALKWFFLAMSVGLMSTTLLGLYMAFQYQRNRKLIWSSLLAGVAIPALLIALLA